MTTNANATLNGTASLVQQQEPLAKHIAKHYPVANATIAIFDILGLIIFLSGFLYFLKCAFVYLWGNGLKWRRNGLSGKDSLNEITLEISSGDATVRRHDFAGNSVRNPLHKK